MMVWKFDRDDDNFIPILCPVYNRRSGPWLQAMSEKNHPRNWFCLVSSTDIWFYKWDDESWCITNFFFFFFLTAWQIGVVISLFWTDSRMLVKCLVTLKEGSNNISNNSSSRKHSYTFQEQWCSSFCWCFGFLSNTDSIQFLTSADII